MNTSQGTWWDFSPTPGAVGEARHLVAETLTKWGVVDRDLIEDVVLIVSELVTNAVIHGRKPINMSLYVEGECVGGTVYNQGAEFDLPSLAGDDDEGGRGLRIVAAYATKWGIDPDGVDEDAGHAVWFQRCW